LDIGVVVVEVLSLEGFASCVVMVAYYFLETIKIGFCFLCAFSNGQAI
jgi:hypothetical protein